VVAAYQAAIAARGAGATPGFVSLDGYLVGRMTNAAPKATSPALTRERFLAAFETLTALDLGGVEMGDHQALDRVYMTRIIAGGAFAPVPVGPRS
jgi:branched-chain amino acid transport system substrate-binding protein